MEAGARPAADGDASVSAPSMAQRTKTWLEAQGFTVEKVEHHLRHSVVTQDFMGFADFLCLRVSDRPGVLAVQATDTSNLSKRVAKIMAEPRADLWLACGNR